MPISWNEIRHNAHGFSKEWADESSEDAEAKSFWDDFFAVFGVKRRTVASFEEPVKNLAGNWAYIDLFWPGTLLVEHKSRGKSLDKANSQAMEYIRGLKDAGRDDEIPRYIAVSDFANFALHDLEEEKTVSFTLSDLHKQVHAFAFIPGYKQHTLDPEDPVNIAQLIELLCKSDGMLPRLGGQLAHFQDKELASCLTSSCRHLRFLSTPAVAESTSSSSFDPSELRKGKLTVFLIVPPEHMRAAAGLTRMWIGTLMRAVVRGGLQRA